jgi:hypothetical protein
MAVELGSRTVNKQERSLSVTRSMPARDTATESALAVQLIIQRERIGRDAEGAVLFSALITPAYVFSYAELSASPAVAAYVTACGASSLAQLMAREADLYDALIAERIAAQS